MASIPPDPMAPDESAACSEGDDVTRRITRERARLAGLQTRLIGLLDVFPTADVHWLLTVLERELGHDVGAMRLELLSVVVSIVISARAPQQTCSPATLIERSTEAERSSRLLRLVSLVVGRDIAR